MNTFPSLNQQIIYPHLESLCSKVHEQKHDLYLDGSLAFPINEPFLPGTISSAFCYFLSALDASHPEFPVWVQKTSDMLTHNSTLTMSTFGILEYLSALYELKKHNLLEQVVSEKVLKTLKQKLDWHLFVDESTWTLKNGLPTNYFGVAFRVALFREQLGWDTEGASARLLDILINHIKTHSGKYLYMDETTGEGRYDKYTISIAAELCELLVEFNRPIPDILRQIMQKCCDILVQLLDLKGNGFCYGRSIGSHGEAVIIETFPVAIRMGIFKFEDLPFIYTATYLTAHKIATFWFNKPRGGFNIWDDGKRTDHYRGKMRVLEVNFDMSLKMLRAENHLKAAGLNNVIPLSLTTYSQWLAQLPSFKYFRFEQETYERGLLIIRTSKHIFSLPIINGGHKHYAHIPYLPLPFCINLLEGTPEESRPMLVPMLTLSDGSKVMPISYMKNIQLDETARTISFYQDTLCNLKDDVYPEVFDGITCHTIFTFYEDQITRQDTFNLLAPLEVINVSLDLDTFSMLDSQSKHQVTLTNGYATSFSVSGMEIISTQDVSCNPAYNTPSGAHTLTIKCESGPKSSNFTTNWTLSYK